MGKIERKKPGRRGEEGPGTGILVRLNDATLQTLDSWRFAQLDRPSRPEALRRLALEGFARDMGYRPAPPPEPLYSMREPWGDPGVRHSIVDPRPKPTREEMMAWLREEMAAKEAEAPKPVAKPKRLIKRRKENRNDEIACKDLRHGNREERRPGALTRMVEAPAVGETLVLEAPP